MLVRDCVPRVTLRQIGAMYRPRDFRQIPSIKLEMRGAVATVTLVRELSIGAKGGRRTWLGCPRCGKKTQVLGVVHVDGAAVWACARRECAGGWRSRKKPRAVTA